jgi:hypothetical protein
MPSAANAVCLSRHSFTAQDTVNHTTACVTARVVLQLGAAQRTWFELQTGTWYVRKQSG